MKNSDALFGFTFDFTCPTCHCQEDGTRDMVVVKSDCENNDVQTSFKTEG